MSCSFSNIGTHRLLAAWLVLPILGGCSSTGEGMFPVSGTVKFADGSPVTGEPASIVFVPNPQSDNRSSKSASGTIEPDGSFRLMTNDPDDGAYPGDYQVVLKVWSDYRNQKLAVPEEYGEPTSTPLSATINADQTTFDFTVER